MGTPRTFIITFVLNTSMSFDGRGIIAEIAHTVVLRPARIRTAITYVIPSVPCPFLQKRAMSYITGRCTETEENLRFEEGRSMRWAYDQERMVSVLKGMVGRRSDMREPIARQCK